MSEGVIVVWKHLLTETRRDAIIALLLRLEYVRHELLENLDENRLGKLEHEPLWLAKLHAVGEHGHFQISGLDGKLPVQLWFLRRSCV